MRQLLVPAIIFWLLGQPLSTSAASACDTGAIQAKIKVEEYRSALTDLEGCAGSKGLARLKGLAYHGLFQPDSAVSFLQLAMKEGNQDDTVLCSLSEALLWNKRNDNSQAHDLLDRVKEKKSTPYLMAMASFYESSRKFSKALEMYNQALANENSALIQFHKALVLSWMDRLDESESLFTTLIDRENLSKGFKLKCRIQRAQVISWKKDLQKAVSELQSILKDAPKSIEARLGLGEVLEWQGLYKQAKDQYRDALLVDPDNLAAKQRLEKLLWVK